MLHQVGGGLVLRQVLDLVLLVRAGGDQEPGAGPVDAARDFLRVLRVAGGVLFHRQGVMACRHQHMRDGRFALVDRGLHVVKLIDGRVRPAVDTIGGEAEQGVPVPLDRVVALFELDTNPGRGERAHFAHRHIRADHLDALSGHFGGEKEVLNVVRGQVGQELLGLDVEE